MQRLVLIDGNAILHRAYHALPPLTNRSGQQVNAVYGFCTMLFRVVADLQPVYLAIAFDTEKPTFRHAAYVGYQAQRPRMESDLASQIKIVQDVVLSMGIPIYVAPGFEADDVIGTLAHQATAGPAAAHPRPTSSLNAAVARRGSPASRHPLEVIIVTGDRDLLQLVSKNVRVYAPIKGLSEARLFDEEGVRELMGVVPVQIVDYKALVGDASDNYPGVTGVGPKTAKLLLGKYKTLEGVYQNLDKIEPPLLDKLAQGHDSAVLSQNLARIHTDAPVTLDVDNAKLQPLGKNQNLIEKLRELGFKSLVVRLEGRVEKLKTVENQLKLV